MVPWRRKRRKSQHETAVNEAAAEVGVSRERLEAMRAEVVRPLVRKGHRNQFAEYIRNSLHEGG